MRITKVLIVLIAVTLSSCSFTNKIKTGEQAYDRKQYAIAVNLLQKEYDETRSSRSKGRKAFLLGKSYDYLKDDNSAVEWLEKAVIHEYGSEAVRDLAFGYKSLGQYQKAINTFEVLTTQVGYRPEINREISICKEAIRWSQLKREEYAISRLYGNSVQADYSPVIFEDEFVVFTSDRGVSTGSGRYNWTGNKFSDLFIMSKDGSQVQPFEATFNTDNNEGAICFNADYTEAFFTRCQSEGVGDAYCGIYFSNRYDGYWTEPAVLDFVDADMNYGQPALIENDSVLVYATKIDKTVSDYDLFYSVRVDNGWSDPYRMPDVINTKGNEMFPTGDGDTLFFSSDYHPGLGGLDIFKTYLDENGRWTRPERLPVPINSSSDDFSFTRDKSFTGNARILEKGYFSTSREGIGDDDIYIYEKQKLEDITEPEVVVDPEPVREREISYYVAGRVVEPIYEEANNPNSEIVGYRPLDLAGIRIVADTGTIASMRSDRTGVFIEELSANSDYTITAGKNRYLNNSVSISTKDIELDSLQEVVTINVEVILNKIFMNREIVLPNIYYDLDKADIRDDAKPTLDALVKMMDDNPDIRIQLSSHTDCRAEDDYNLDLSQRRAISAVMYMIENGIDKERLVPKGYGETQLAVDCICEECTEEQHQQNRRTTFKIIP